MNKKLNIIKYISIISLMIMMVGVVFAVEQEQKEPTKVAINSIADVPGAITEMSSKNPYLAIVYIMGLITCGSLYFAWRQLEIIKKNAESITAIHGDFNRVIDNLNNRPCIKNTIDDIKN